MPDPIPTAIQNVADAIVAHNVLQAQIVDCLDNLKVAIKENTRGSWGRPPPMNGGPMPPQ